MARSTSKESWKDFKDSDSQALCYRAIIEILERNGNLTGREICKKAGRDGLWKRLSELRTRGFIEEAGKRICSVTGKKAIVWKLKSKKKKSPFLIDRKEVHGIALNDSSEIRERRLNMIEKAQKTANEEIILKKGVSK